MAFEADEADGGGEAGRDAEAYEARSEYQIYTDSEYKPKRFIGPVELKRTEGGATCLAASGPVDPGTLLMLLPALAFLEADFGSVPEPEDLHAAMLEDGLSAPLRRVLDAMYDGTPESLAKDFSSLTTIDPKFWASRGANDAGAPPVDARRLLSIIRSNCLTDSQQDAASMHVRQQAPAGFVGLWPEFSMLSHSCAPNTSLVVVGDRMLMHSATELPPGEPLTRNTIGTLVTAPLGARREALAAIGAVRGVGAGGACGCARCVTEAGASEAVRGALDDAFSWYQEEALPQWNACQESEDLEGLRTLRDEAAQIVEEVEEAVMSEEGLDDTQRMWLRASAYDAYDMLVMTDEFVAGNASSLPHLRGALELIRAFAPGSESHTAVAVKYDALARERAELAEYMATQELQAEAKTRRRRGLGLGVRGSGASGGGTSLAAVRSARELRETADDASELYLDAFFTRYGFLSLKSMETLREGLEMFNEALEQMSIMRAEGKTESQQDYIIDGVKFSLVDKLGSALGGAPSSSGRMSVREASAAATGAGDASSSAEVGYEVASAEGVRVMVMEAAGGQGWADDVLDVEALDVGRGGAAGDAAAAAAGTSAASDDDDIDFCDDVPGMPAEFLSGRVGQADASWDPEGCVPEDEWVGDAPSPGQAGGEVAEPEPTGQAGASGRGGGMRRRVARRVQPRRSQAAEE